MCQGVARITEAYGGADSTHAGTGRPARISAGRLTGIGAGPCRTRGGASHNCTGTGDQPSPRSAEASNGPCTHDTTTGRQGAAQQTGQSRREDRLFGLS